jgi:hypothetical protein
MAADLNARSDLLARFLAAAAARPFQYGAHDCGLWLADWVSLSRQIPDPAAHLRGGYDDVESALALCGPLGLARTVDRLAGALGLARTQEPRAGDIAVIRLERRGPAYGAIRSRCGFAILGEPGERLCAPPFARVIAAWRV